MFVSESCIGLSCRHVPETQFGVIFVPVFVNTDRSTPGSASADRCCVCKIHLDKYIFLYLSSCAGVSVMLDGIIM